MDHSYPSKKLLSSLIASSLAIASNGASSQTSGAPVEEVLVVGVRGAQERAIDIKRNAAELVDLVAAEDIGKLPDTTIADSLQRVTGVQIQRSGGQGSIVSVRGMTQVLSTLNGEEYLLPASMTTNGVDFTDVPASLVSGLAVSKSQSARLLEGGIGGSVDLRTQRALELPQGYSGSVRLQGSRGSITDSTDPELSGLLGWNHDGRLAMSLALSYSEATLANNRGRLRTDRAGETWECGGTCQDLDGNGDEAGDFFNPMNWQSPEFSSIEIGRERLGMAYNFNLVVSDALELSANVFYTRMEEKSAGQFLYLGNQIGGRAGFHEYVRVTGEPAFIRTGDGSLGGQPYYATDLRTMVQGFRGGVIGTYRDSSALNTDLELSYDNGGPFTGSIRWVAGKADTDVNELILAQVTNGLTVVREPGGAPVEINPGAIADGLVYPMRVTLNGDHVAANLDPLMSAKMADPTAWYLHSGWIEGAEADADFDVLRADGTFTLAEEGITSVDFGWRFSSRTVTNTDLSFFSPSGVFDADGNELLNKYHEVGYAIGQSGTTGTAQGLTYDPLPVIQLEDPRLQSYITRVTHFGEALKGLNVGIPMVDVSRIDDPIAFNDRLYGKGERIANPDRSYVVADSRESVHVQVNFDQPLSDIVRLSGNAGVRRVTTDLTVTQNITDPNMLNPRILAGVDPVHTTYVDLGDKVTVITYSHFLPSINLNFSLFDQYKIKLAYDKRIALQNLNSLGDGSITYFASEAEGEEFQRVSSRQNNGNPYLKPWEANVLNAAVEWYPTDDTILALGFFNIDVASFTYTQSEHNPTLADSDGTVRRGGEERTIANGSGGSVKGYEFSYQQSFTFLPGPLANTGITFNYTYSPSESPSDQIMPSGELAPFNNTAEDQMNLILWYQDDKAEFRIAANYLGKQYQGMIADWMWTPPNNAVGMPRYLESTLFVDLTASYYLLDNLQLTLAVNNATKENNVIYTQWQDYKDSYDIFERRITAGVNYKF
jgi:TonB-dependent receptor